MGKGRAIVPFVASAALAELTISPAKGHFADRYARIPVFHVSNGLGFSAFVYMCRLNLDFDGAPDAYGLDNPNNAKQQNLNPLERLHGQKVGLGNAAGDPGDGTKGWKNFLSKPPGSNRKFYWAGIRSAKRGENIAATMTLDDRDELEAGLQDHAKDGKPKVVPKGQGWFPLVQKDTGYYISTTSMVADASASDSHRYLDSSVVPYAVWANNWARLGLRQGDFGLAIENVTGANMPYVYGDSGTVDKVGECSEKLNYALGKGAGYVTFIAFPGSGAGPKHALGAHPESQITAKVFAKTMELENAKSEFASFLATGPYLEISKQTRRTSWQSFFYHNFLSALSPWTFGA
jgi:hypothetical protein